MRCRRSRWLLVLVALAGCGDGVATTAPQDEVVAAPTTVTTAPPRAADPAAFPLAVRAEVVLVWTGTEIVAWGGDVEGPNVGLTDAGFATYADGAAYDPASGTWRVMAPSPLPAVEGGSGVWAGDRVVIARGTQVAAWDPVTDTWVDGGELATPPRALAWTGSEVIVIGPDIALDPHTLTARALPPAPAAITWGEAFWTGAEVVVLGATQPPGAYQGEAAAYAYDPAADTWRTVPAPGIAAQAIDAAWNGREIVAAEYDMVAKAYDPVADRWRDLPGVPARFSEWYPRVEAMGGDVVVMMASNLLVLDERDAWLPTPDPAGASPAWSRWVATDAGLWRFGIDLDAGTSVLEPFERPDDRHIQVGSYALDLPDSIDFLSAALDRGADGHDNAVVVQLGTLTGECTVTGAHPARPAADGSVLLAESQGDSLVAVCDDPADIAHVAAAVR